MRRSELAHILRAAARITGDPDILIIGSQSILGSYDEDDLPAEAWVSDAPAASLREGVTCTASATG